MPPIFNDIVWTDFGQARYPGRTQLAPLSGFGTNINDDGYNPLLPSSMQVPGYRKQHAGRADDTFQRSSLGATITNLRQAGGPNSFDNYIRSWKRAAGFYEIAPARASFKAVDGNDKQVHDERTDEERGFQQDSSPLQQQLEQDRPLAENAVSNSSTFENETSEDDEQLLLPQTSTSSRLRSDRVNSIFLSASPIAASFGTSYGTLGSRFNEPARRQALEPYLTHEFTVGREREPLFVKYVEQNDDTLTMEIIGQSTLPQTISNSINVLIGVGLLGLPMGLKYSGWIFGMLELFLAAACTAYTARLLAKCLEANKNLVTFADLAHEAFGPPAQFVVSILFTLELVAANVALTVLFADSLNALVPSISLIQFKILCGLILIPLYFVPIRFLSFSSTVGILCCLGILMLTVFDGLIKGSGPGSLREPAVTHLFPADWRTLPLSFGLLLSPWGGHGVFPNLYRDMRHPAKFPKAVKIAFSFTYLLDVGMAVIGILMFGANVMGEITANLLLTPGYPEATKFILIILISIIPLTKIPLNAHPILSIAEILARSDAPAIPSISRQMQRSEFTRKFFKASLRIMLIMITVVISIIFPAFDRIMALMGSALCFTICIILPLSFHLKLFGNEMSHKERILHWVLIVISSLMALVGTVWVFLPRESIGANAA